MAEPLPPSLPGRRYDAIVIGAGPNGLTAARVLGRRRRKGLGGVRADGSGLRPVTTEWAAISPAWRPGAR